MTGLEARVEVTLGHLDLRVDVVVAPDETVAVVGPNGAGKTTLLRVVAGVLPLDGGRVALDGAVLDDVAARRRLAPEDRAVGMVPQDHVLFPHLSALDNVAFGLRSRGHRKADARAIATGWLERVGLSGFADQRPHHLSGGQAQRVALARALASDPKLLLLDEPLAALDATTHATTRRDLRRHLDAFGGPRLLVTHDPVDAMTLADRLVVLEEGRIVQQGTPADIAGRPRSTYVADLVGVNLLRGTASGDTVAIDGGGALTVPDAGRGPVLVVLHPRAVALHRTAPDGTPRNVWQGTVRNVDREGARARVIVDGRPPIVAEVTAEAIADLDIAPGHPVWVAVKATEVSVYPA
jgi:molybdate transport system ATP-binding protein